MDAWIKIFLLVSFVIFIPASAACYYYSRSSQRHSEVMRYLSILNIKKIELFEHKHPVVSLTSAVLYVTIISVCFWWLILFGEGTDVVTTPNYLFGGASILINASVEDTVAYQSGALLTFSMAFLGAYLWGIQNIARRYSMNDLIPAAYYNVGVRMIFACILALVFYHLSKMIPDFFTGMFIDPSQNTSDNGENGGENATQMFMPIVAFLIGFFPQRGLKWLTEKFSMFTHQQDPTVRDLPLEMIEGIKIYDRVRLQELGIDSCYDLANADYIPYLFKSPYSPRVLINWILQAKLCVYFGENVKDLREHGIHTVWQLKDYDFEKLVDMAKTTALTEDTIIMVYEQAKKDKEIERLIEAQLELSQYWNKKDKN